MPFRTKAPDAPADLEGSVVLRAFASLPEAEMAHTQLEGHGIASQIEDSTVAGVHPWIVPALGGVRVTVRETDLLRAQEILEALEQETQEADQARSDDDRLSDEADAQARRALSAAVFGIAILPVVAQLYSLHLVITLKHVRLREEGVWRMRVALAVDLVILAGALALGLWMRLR